MSCKEYGNILNIKSNFILKVICSFIWKNKKLIIISYDKHIQKLILVKWNRFLMGPIDESGTGLTILIVKGI